jgi:hypothetical protein
MELFVRGNGDSFGGVVIDIEVQFDQKSDIQEKKGCKPEMVTNPIRFLVVQPEKFDFGEYGDIVKGPVTEVTCTGKKFKDIGERLFFREEDLGHAFVFIDAFEEAEDFPGFFGGL